MNVIALRTQDGAGERTGMKKGHSVAHVEVTLLRCFGNKSHFEGKNHGFTRF